MSALLARFEDRDALVDALRAQKIIQGDRSVAEALADVGQRLAFAPGEELIAQGGPERDVYFLLAGSVELRVNGVLLPYDRSAGEAIGEFSAINPALPRTATVVAAEEVVALKCGHTALIAAGRSSNELWRLLAVDLTRKIEQRNQFISASNDRPYVFMIAPEDALDVAEEIRLGLASANIEVMLWSDEDLFPPGSYMIENLHRMAALADFGIALAHPDELRRSRDRKALEPRDSILFEVGYFMSVLGRHRTLLLIPEDEAADLPGEFKGLRPITYARPAHAPIDVALAPTIRRIRNVILERKMRSRLESRD